MIRAGRTVVDRAGVADLYGTSFYWARDHEIWNTPGFPEPVTNTTRQRGGQARRRTWDEEQVVAARDGKTVPPLPDIDSPWDLFDVEDVAAWRGVQVTTVVSDVRDGRYPFPDEQRFGMWFWYRATVNNPVVPETTAPENTDLSNEQRIRQILDSVVNTVGLKRTSSGTWCPDITLSDLARRAGVSRPTASGYRAAYVDELSARRSRPTHAGTRAETGQ